ncbi:GNAT family N-acetyltransferase [Roseovarius sp. S4756]|uniref:GNAT family N-acetyltransferase n=1 Tax=Roseovarius maritimus TaxID=3342637 RepID=UPI00372B6C0D
MHAPFAVAAGTRSTENAGEMPAPCTVLETADKAVAHIAAWQALLKRSAEPNVFFAPGVLLPAMRHLSNGKQIRIILIHHPDDTGRLIGVFPVVFCRRFHGLPLRHVTLWLHAHVFVAAPPVDPQFSAIAWRGFLAWARGSGALFVNLPLQVDGPGSPDAVAGPSLELDRFSRPVFIPDAAGADNYIRTACSPKSRKSWRRQLRRLAEQGRLELRQLGDKDDLTPWVEDFLELEAASWKGKVGTAIASDPNEAAFFREMMGHIHGEGGLHFLGYYLDGRPVSMQCNLFEGGVGYAFKVAFDEEHASLSPGALLELAAVAGFHGRAGLVMVDSCASRDHPLMGRIWTDTRDIRRLILPVPGLRERLVFAGLQAGLRLRRMLGGGRS